MAATPETDGPSHVDAPLKISVVIPVYNLERYLEESLMSVLDQTLADIEVVCVDDGSTDGSSQMLADFARRDRRVVVIRQENAGQSAARNAGMKAVRGEYLYFLDGDDKIRADALESLYRDASRNELDILCFDADAFFDSADLEEQYASYKTRYSRKFEYEGVQTGPDLFVQMTANGEYRPNVPMQLFRTAFLLESGVTFFEGIVHEDNPFTFLAILKARRVSHTGSVYLHRRFRADSTMTSQGGVGNFVGCVVGAGEMLKFTMREELQQRVAEAANVHIANIIRRATLVLRGLSRAEREQLVWEEGSLQSLLSRFMLVHGRELRDATLRFERAEKQLARVEKELRRYKALDTRTFRRLERTWDSGRRRLKSLFGVRN